MTFEFDLNLYRIDRAVYGILDWISDIGGLSDGLILLITAILPIMNFKTFEHFLIEHLFVKRDLEPSPKILDNETAVDAVTELSNFVPLKD